MFQTDALAEHNLYSARRDELDAHLPLHGRACHRLHLGFLAFLHFRIRVWDLIITRLLGPNLDGERDELRVLRGEFLDLDTR